LSEPFPEAKTHDLKTWPIFFALVAGGHKSFEVRRNDRDFQMGDTLILREWEPGPYPPEGYTGHELRRRVHWVFDGAGLGLLAEGVVVMEIREEAP
jgi:hypothetical protein